MPVVATPIASASGWVTVLEADMYFGTRQGASALWSGLDPTAKVAALTTAERDLEFCPDFTFTDAQKAAPSSAMKYAECEQTLFRLQDPDSDIRTGLIVQGVAAAWTVQEQYNKSRGATPICPTARQMLAAYASASNMNGAVPLYRPEAECPT